MALRAARVLLLAALGVGQRVGALAIAGRTLAPRPAAATAASPPPPVVAHDAGLALSLALPAGPYFVGELLPVTLALANGSDQPVALFGGPTPDACGAALDLVAAGGGPPTFTLLPAVSHTCPGGQITTVLSGQTLTVRQLLPLAASGAVPLTAQAQFVQTTHAPSGVTALTVDKTRFRRRWPSVRIAVAPTAPAGRSRSADWVQWSSSAPRPPPVPTYAIFTASPARRIRAC